MTDETENLTLEILKRVQADIAALRTEVTETRRDLGERMSRLEVRMTAQEQHLATLVLSCRKRMDASTI